MSKKITLVIEKLRFKTVIGILESERDTPQEIEVSAKILVCYNKNKIVNYVTIRDTIKHTIMEGKFLTVEEALVETSEQIGNIDRHILKVKLKILKLSILENAVVGASMKKIFKKYKNKFKNS